MSSSDSRSSVPLLLSTANAIGLGLAYRHLRNFWRHKAKVPFLSDYNEGISASNQLQQALAVLAVSWVVSGVAHAWPSAGN